MFMKRMCLLLALLLPLVMSAQIVTEKSIKDYSYGEKKLRKAPKKLYIKEFYINYQVLASETATSINRSNRDEVSMTIGLVSDLTADDMQALTNRAYSRVKTRLEKAGIELVTFEEAGQIKQFQGKSTVAGGMPSSDHRGYVYTAPEGARFYNAGGVGLVDIAGKISKQLGDIPVLDFASTVRFIELMEDRQMGGASSIKGNISFELVPYSSKISWKGGAPMAAVNTQIQIGGKGGRGIEIPGVIEKQKVGKRVEADYHYDFNMNMKYYKEQKTVITNPVKVDKQTYLEKAEQAINEYLDIFLDKYLEGVEA